MAKVHFYQLYELFQGSMEVFYLIKTISGMPCANQISFELKIYAQAEAFL